MMHITGTTMHQKGRIISALLVLFIMIFCFSLYFNASTAEAKEPKNVHVPIKIEVPHAVAGVEFEIEYTSGLTLISYEKSEIVNKANKTPIVEKNGKTHFGFFYGSNDFAPEGGLLDIGYLVFEHSGEPDQYILLTEVKYVVVIDKDTTENETIPLSKKIDVPYPPDTDPETTPTPDPSTSPSTSPSPSPSPGTNPGSDPGPKLGEGSNATWIIMWCVSVAAIGGMILYDKRKKAGKASQEKA